MCSIIIRDIELGLYGQFKGVFKKNTDENSKEKSNQFTLSCDAEDQPLVRAYLAETEVLGDILGHLQIHFGSKEIPWMHVRAAMRNPHFVEDADIFDEDVERQPPTISAAGSWHTDKVEVGGARFVGRIPWLLQGQQVQFRQNLKGTAGNTKIYAGRDLGTYSYYNQPGSSVLSCKDPDNTQHRGVGVGISFVSSLRSDAAEATKEHFPKVPIFVLRNFNSPSPLISHPPAIPVLSDMGQFERHQTVLTFSNGKGKCLNGKTAMMGHSQSRKYCAHSGCTNLAKPPYGPGLKCAGHGGGHWCDVEGCKSSARTAKGLKCHGHMYMLGI